MHPTDVDRAVAKASGESIETISRRGFVLLTPTPRECEPSTNDYEDLLARIGAPDSGELPGNEAGPLL